MKKTLSILAILSAAILVMSYASSAQIYFGGMNGTGSFTGDTLSVNASQNAAGGFSFTGDVTSDPTLTVDNNIDNTSAFPWVGYAVSVSMNQPFTISAASVTTPPDWFVASMITPVTSDNVTWTGSIFYSEGTPVLPNGTLDFGFTVSFDNLSFQLNEGANPVPEPGVLALGILGGLAFLWFGLGLFWKKPEDQQ